MKKLTTLFAVLALSAAVAGCKKKKDGEGDNAPKTDEKADDKGMAAKPDDKGMAAKPDDKGMAAPAGSAAAAPAGSAAAAPAAAGGGDLPQECKDYKAAIEKLATCDKMDAATRDGLKKAFEASQAGWAAMPGMPADQKKMLTDGCKSGADGLNTTGKTVCGW